MWRSLQKQDRGTKQREQSTAIQGAKISCEFPKCQFRTPLFKVRKFSHRANQGAKISHTSIQGAKFIPVAKLPPGTRVPFRTPQATFRTVRNKVEIFDKLSAKFNLRREAEETSPRTSCEPLELTNSHLAPFRPWQRLGEVFPHPHPRRCLDQSSPVERLLSAGIPPGGHPLTLCHPPPKPRGSLLATDYYSKVRPMIAGPPIEGNLDCRDRSFHSETWFDVEALRQQPELRDSFRLLQRVVLDFYQSMTTRGVRNPTLIHFTIDGRQGAIGARHIVEALQLQGVVLILSRGHGSYLVQGTSTASVLTRRELPSGMVLIDVLCALFRISEGYYCTSATLESPALRGAAIAERTSLSTNGITWQPTLHLREPQLCLHLREPQLCPHLQSYPTMSSYLRPSRMRFSLTLHLLPLQHTPQCTCLRLHFLLLLSLRVLHQSCQLPQHLLLHLSPLSPFLLRNSRLNDSLIQDDHYSCTPDQIIATRTKDTTIFHQIQQHLSMQTLPGHDRSGPSEPPLPDEEIIPAEQPIPDEEIRAEPSHDPTTI
ncbi:hypothetical protein AAG906_017415 [Vitis piasezkii]